MCGGGDGGSGGADSSISVSAPDLASELSGIDIAGLSAVSVDPAISEEIGGQISAAQGPASLSGVGHDDPTANAPSVAGPSALGVVGNAALGLATGGPVGMGLSLTYSAVQAIAAEMGLDLSPTGIATALGVNLGGIDLSSTGPGPGQESVDSSYSGQPWGVGSTVTPSVLTASANPPASSRSLSSAALASLEAADAAARREKMLAEFETERQRLAGIDAEARRREVANAEQSRYSFGELNITGPFGLSDVSAPLFRPRATPVQKYKLGA